MSRHGAPLASAAPDTVFAPAALELVDLRKRYGAALVLDGVSLRVEQGERVALIGPNGAGKSTLFDIASGRTRPSDGEVWVAGRRLDGRPPEQLRRAGLARSFQVSQVFGRLSVRDNLRCAVLAARGLQGVFWKRLSQSREVDRRADELMELLGLHARGDDLAGSLGYAEQRALELGITVAGDPDVLLLDEPTAGRSQHETEGLVALIRELSEGRSLLLVEHDMQVVFGLADRIAVLVEGALIAFDTPARIRANPRVQAAYGHEALASA